MSVYQLYLRKNTAHSHIKRTCFPIIFFLLFLDYFLIEIVNSLPNFKCK